MCCLLFSGILQSNGVKIESSAIIGDAQPLDYTPEPAAKHISLFDARNVALRGCYCTEGETLGLFFRTGKYTVGGKKIYLRLLMRSHDDLQ